MIQARSSLRNLEPTILHWCQLTTLIRNCCRDMAAQGERQLEILTAFAGKKKNSKSENQKTPSLAWMYSQCAAPPKSAEFSLFSRYSGDVSKVPPMEHQPYHYWKSMMEMERFAHPIRYRRHTILIQPLSHSQASSRYKHTEIHPSVLSHLCNFCQQFFHEMNIEVAQPIDLSQIPKLTQRIHQTTNREQFLVSDIRKFLQSRRPNRVFCVLGVTVADLYPSPEWNFVLGEASMAQGCGVFTFGRYFNSSAAAKAETAACAIDGGDGDSDGERKSRDCEMEQLRNLWVLMRVMSHELCHIFGLKHCFYFDCAMNESNTIIEAATQPLFLCPICLRKMQKAVGFDPLQRYVALLKVIEQLHSAVLEASAQHAGDETLSDTVTVEIKKCENDIQRKRPDCRSPRESEPKQEDGKENAASGGLENETGLVDEACNHPHGEQFERSIVWLQRVISNLRQFEDEWAEQRMYKSGHRTKNKIV